MTLIAYKLFRELKTGEITSLFINKSRRLPIGEWMESESIPTNGFALRPGWHCTVQPHAPHLKMELKSGERRVWKMVLIEDYTEERRPENQGGLWYLANKVMILPDSICELIKNQSIADPSRWIELANKNPFPIEKFPKIK